MTPSLRLQSIALHDVLEGTVFGGDFSHHVDRAHEQLVQMTVYEHPGMRHQSVFEARPDLTPQLVVDL